MSLKSEIKSKAGGAWPNLLSSLAGLPLEILDGRHHPCPRCGGKDRFRLLDADKGALFCNKCFSERNGDGIAAVQWATGWDFQTTLEKLADALGIEHKKRQKRDTSPAAQLEFKPWVPQVAALFARKKGVTLEALKAAGAQIACWRQFETVIAIPILSPDMKVRGYSIYNTTGAPLKKYDGSSAKILATRNSKAGWIGKHALENLAAAEIIWKVEGPSDLLALWSYMPPAAREKHVVVTNAFGSKERPRPELLKIFSGKRAFVVHDEDEAGQEGAGRWAAAIAEHADEVKIVHLPQPGIDLRDWIQAGHTYAELATLAKAADPVKLEAEGGDQPGEQKTSGQGQETKGIFNFEEQAEGDGKPVKYALRLSNIVANMLALTGGYPKSVAGELFFVDSKGALQFLLRPDDLFAYLHHAAHLSGGVLGWQKPGLDPDDASFVTRQEFFSALRHHVDSFDDYSDYPLHPQPDNVFLTSRYNIGEKPSDGAALLHLVSKFNPATQEDEGLIFALILSLFWGGRPGTRPFFLVTGPESTGVQETGKTSFVEMVAGVVGGVFRLQLEDRKYGDNLVKQLLSDEAMKRRVVLLDNLDGFTHSRELAELLTAAQIDGRPSHGRQRSRANYLNWVATAVSPALDSDLASRAFTIQLSPPDRDGHPMWAEETGRFIEENRLGIIRDALMFLSGPKYAITERHSRFPAWDREVLACSMFVNDVLRKRASRVQKVDSELEGLALFLGELKAQASTSTDLATPTVRYSVSALVEVWEKANRQKISSTWLGRKLRLFQARGDLPPGLALLSPKKHGSPWEVDPDRLEIPSDEPSDGELNSSPGELSSGLVPQC